MTPSRRQNSLETGWNFGNSYAQLPEAFYVRLNPVPVRKPKLVIFNVALAGPAKTATRFPGDIPPTHEHPQPGCHSPQPQGGGGL
jgi:hypothetical protein